MKWEKKKKSSYLLHVKIKESILHSKFQIFISFWSISQQASINKSKLNKSTANLPEFGVIHSHRLGGPAGLTTSISSETSFAGLKLLCLTVLLGLTVLADEQLDEVSEEQVLSTETLFRTTASGISDTGFLGLCGGFFKPSFLRFGASETLTLFPPGPSTARGSQIEDWSFVATDIAVDIFKREPSWVCFWARKRRRFSWIFSWRRKFMLLLRVFAWGLWWWLERILGRQRRVKR